MRARGAACCGAEGAPLRRRAVWAGAAAALAAAGLAWPPALGAAAAVGGIPLAVAAVRARRVGIEALMAIAIAGAAALGEWLEAAAVAVLFQSAEALEAAAVGRARRSVRDLLEAAPRDAEVRRAGVWVRVPADSVETGEIVRARPGERIAVDGEVVDGRADVDEAPVTGESRPAAKGPGDDVFAGTIVVGGALEVRASRPARAGAVARLLAEAERAAAEKSRYQRLADSFARWYTPAVVAGAAAYAGLAPHLVGLPPREAVYRALVLLVVACPCALVLATPVAFLAGVARAARRGVLVKGGRFLEALGAVEAVILDKTGTLTVGRPEVRSVVAFTGSNDDLLAAAAAVEGRSEHPVGRAIVEAAERGGVAIPPATGFEAVAGAGAGALVAGRPVWVGRHALFEERGWCRPGAHAADEAAGASAEDDATVVHVGGPDGCAGAVALADRLRAEARGAVAALRAAGIRRIVVATGDAARPARAAAEAAGIGPADLSYGLLPDEKVALVRRVGAGGRVAFVGDGANDAPALAAATVGIALGHAAATDAALEAADVVILGDDLRRVVEAVALGRRVRRVVAANVALALGAKAAVLAAAAAGAASLGAAIAADVGASLVVIANGLRLVATRPGAPHD